MEYEVGDPSQKALDRSCFSRCWRRIGRQAAGESVGESEDRGREGGVPASSGHHGRKQRGTWRGGGGSGGARGLPRSNGCCWTGGASCLADAPEVSCQVIWGMLSGADQTHAALRAPHLPGRHLAQGCFRLEKALSLARRVTDHHWMWRGRRSSWAAEQLLWAGDLEVWSRRG